MEFFKKATQISKALAYTNILSPKSIFKVASIFGQREGPLDVECHIYRSARTLVHTFIYNKIYKNPLTLWWCIATYYSITYIFIVLL